MGQVMARHGAERLVRQLPMPFHPPHNDTVTETHLMQHTEGKDSISSRGLVYPPRTIKRATSQSLRPSSHASPSNKTCGGE